MAKKKEKRTDVIAQAEELTGIHYQEIIHSAYSGAKFTWNEIDEIVYSYEAGNRAPKRVYEFASFLIQEWKKENGVKFDKNLK
jgi:hypothetical protein